MKKSPWSIVAIIGSVLFSAGYVTAALLFTDDRANLVVMFVTFALVILLFTIGVRRNKGVAADEFTIRQDLKSYRNSWLFTLLAITVIGNLDYFGIYTLPMKNAIGTILMVMVLSFWISHFIYMKKPNAS